MQFRALFCCLRHLIQTLLHLLYRIRVTFSNNLKMEVQSRFCFLGFFLLDIFIFNSSNTSVRIPSHKGENFFSAMDYTYVLHMLVKYYCPVSPDKNNILMIINHILHDYGDFSFRNTCFSFILTLPSLKDCCFLIVF